MLYQLYCSYYRVIKLWVTNDSALKCDGDLNAAGLYSEIESFKHQTLPLTTFASATRLYILKHIHRYSLYPNLEVCNTNIFIDSCNYSYV